MLLERNELVSMNLKGFKFFESYQGYNMTSRNAWIRDYYVVVQDDCDKCIIADLDNRNKVEEKDRDWVISNIVRNPLIQYDKEKKEAFNDIEII